MSSSVTPEDPVSSVISSVQERVASAIDASIRPHLTQLQIDVDTSNVLREMLLRLPEHQTLLTENRRLRRRLGEASPSDGVVLEVHDADGQEPAWVGSDEGTCVAPVDVEDIYMHEAVDTASESGEPIPESGADDCDEAMAALSLDDSSDEETSNDLGQEAIAGDNSEDVASAAELADAGIVEEEEDYYSVTIPLPEGEREFFTNDASNGEICEITEDGDIGDTVGRFVGGRAVFD